MVIFKPQKLKSAKSFYNYDKLVLKISVEERVTLIVAVYGSDFTWVGILRAPLFNTL